MRTASLVICALSLLAASPAPARACADLVELFVARGSYDRDFAARVLDLSSTLRTTEIRLHEGRTGEVRAGLEALLAKWFELYGRYASAPPTGWVGRAEWLPRLGDVSRAMTALSAALESADAEVVHERVREMNAALVALFKEGAPNSDATLLDLAGATLDRLRAGLLSPRRPEDLALAAADLATLAGEIGRAAPPAGLSEPAAADFAAARDAFARAAAALPAPFTPGATAEAALAAAEAALADFRARRARLLQREWFGR